MTLQSWPVLYSPTIEAIAEKLAEMDQIREDDISEFSAIGQTFVSGRRVAKIPVSSTDIAATDRAGDISYTATYLYIAVLNGGTLSWRRIALSSW